MPSSIGSDFSEESTGEANRTKRESRNDKRQKAKCVDDGVLVVGWRMKRRSRMGMNLHSYPRSARRQFQPERSNPTILEDESANMGAMRRMYDFDD